MSSDPTAAAAGPSRRPPALYAIILAVALLVVASPILIFPIPPLYDYPAHLAREFIIHDLLTQGSFSAMYRLHFAVIPNLGMETVVLPLLFLGVPIEIAGRLFLLLIVTLLGTGIVRVHRALFHKASLFPLLSLAFIFNPIFMFGFANFLLGFAIALHAFAWWLGARHRPLVAILPVFLLWIVALFFCHLMPAILFLGLIGSYETSRALIERKSGDAKSPNLLRTFTLLAVAAVVLAILYSLGPLSTASQTSQATSIAEILKRIAVRLKALPLYPTAYSPPVDATVLLVLAAMMVWALWLGRLRLSWPMLTPIIGLMVIYTITPDDWAGTNYIAYRIPTTLIFLAFASIDVAWDKHYLPALAVAGVVGLRTIAALFAWAEADAQYQPMLRALERLPSHSSIYTGANYQGPFEPLIRMPWSHFESYAAIRNRLFVHGVFADPTQNWIMPTPEYAERAKLTLDNNRLDRRRSPGHDSDMFSPVFRAHYDFLLAIQPELYRKPIPPGVRIIARSGNATLFSLHNR